MSNFINYLNNKFSKLAKEPTTIITANSNNVWVNSIIICNRGNQNIRFNLKLLDSKESPEEAFLINELSIDAFSSIDVLKACDLTIYLQHSLLPIFSDSLVCFSNGSTQVFDCTVNYAQLTELPMA